MDLKQTAVSIAMMTFVLSSMIGMGLGLRMNEIVTPLRVARLMARLPYRLPVIGISQLMILEKE